MLGVIGGSSFLKSEALQGFRPFAVDTARGRVRLFRGPPGSNVVFVQRHAASDKGDYSPPHLIDAAAIAAALDAVGVRSVVALGSVGTLRPKDIKLGTLVLPDDYCNLGDGASTGTAHAFSGAGHVKPGFDAALRGRLLAALASGGFDARDGGVYGQTTGPRFETPAEIAHLARAAHVVGMTCSREASVFGEAGVPYALACMVDNLGNGLEPADGRAFSVDDFHAGVKRNQATMDRLLAHVLAEMAPGAAPAAPGAPAPRQVDLVVSARHVVPVRDAEPGAVLDRHAVVVDGGRIVDVLPEAEVWGRYSPAEHADLAASHALIPGLVNAHTHAGMSALRGFADDHPLLVWLHSHIWPAEGRHVSADFVRAGTELAIAEMVRGGTTAMMDQYFFMQSTAEAADAAGFRASVGAAMLDFPTSFAADFDAYAARAEELAGRWRDHPLVRVSLAPHAPYTVCDEHLERVREMSERLGLRVQMHLHETCDEAEHSRELREGSPATHRSKQRCDPVTNLARIGLLAAPGGFSAVHMTALSDENVAAVAAAGASVVHCPHSNMKLASGVCPVQRLLDAGVNVALGTDGVASNNAHDMFAEMKTAALLAKVSTGRADALPAAQALRMATLGGARALGLGDEVGSIEVGKAADLVAVRLDEIETVPVYDVVSHLVYSCSRTQVSDVWVAGRRLLRARELTTVDEARVKREANEWGRVIAEAAAAAAADKE